VKVPVVPEQPAVPPAAFTASEARFCAILSVPLLVLIFFKLFLLQQPADPDDGGYVNPILEFVHHGRVVYPAHGLDHAQSMTIHPPVHSWLAGLMIKAGMSLYPALGTMPFVMAALCLLAIATSSMSRLWKLSMFFGIFAVNFLLMPVQLFRPEMELSLAWLGGITLLATARLENWSPIRLLGGSFLTAYASGLHYWAAPAVLACAIYAVWVIVDVGFRKALRSILCIAIGALAFMIPYLVLFVIPERTGIWNVISGLHAVAAPGQNSYWSEMLEAFRYHRQAYFNLSAMGEGFSAALLFPVLYFGVPALFICIPAIFISVQTRGLALASVPLLLPLLFLFKHKSPPYFRCELSLAYALLLYAILVGLQWLVARAGKPVSESQFTIGIAVLLGVIATSDVRPWRTFWGGRMVDEVALERAFGKSVLGPDALVAGRSICLWYTSGGLYYRNVTGDLIYPRDISNVNTADFFSTFDGVAEDGNGSWVTYNRQQMSLSSWYLNGDLQLLGLYCARASTQSWHPYPDVGYYLIGIRRTEPVQAIFWRGASPVRFIASDDKQAALAAISLPTGQPLDAVAGGEFIFRLGLAPDGKRDLRFYLMPKTIAATIANKLPAGCNVRDLIYGKVEPLDEQAMLRTVDYRKDMASIFYTSEEARAARAVAAPGAAPIRVAEEKVLPGADVHIVDGSTGNISVNTSPLASAVVLSSPSYDLQGESWYLLNFDLRLEAGNLALDIIDSQGHGLYQAFKNYSQPFQQHRAVFKVEKASKIVFQVWTNNPSPDRARFQLKDVYLQKVIVRETAISDTTHQPNQRDARSRRVTQPEAPERAIRYQAKAAGGSGQSYATNR
jgi:hypothetical protein